MKVNVSLKVNNHGKEEFCTLINAGENRYQAEGSCEVILDDTNEVTFWMHDAKGSQVKAEQLSFCDLPKRENRTTRFRIVIKPLSDKNVEIFVTDLGFGELVKSSGMSWRYVMIGEW